MLLQRYNLLLLMSHLYYFMQRGADKMEDLEKLKIQVQMNYKDIVRGMTLERYIDGLIQENYFDLTDKELVMKEATTEAKNRQILDLLYIKNPKAYQVLIQEMQDDERDDVVRKIQNTVIKTGKDTGTTERKKAASFKPCDICVDQLPAIAFCEKCREIYCQQCAIMHKKFKASKDHVIVQIGKNLSQSFQMSTGDQLASSCGECSASDEPTYSKELQVPVLQEKKDCPESRLKFKLKSRAQHLTLPERKPFSIGPDQLASDFDKFSVSERLITHRAQVPVLLKKEDSPLNEDEPKLKRKTLFFQLKFKTEFHTCDKSDMLPCSSLDALCLPNGHVAVMDYSNDKLKLFDDKYKRYSTTNILGHAVASVKDNIIVVAIYSKMLFYECNGNTVKKLSQEFELSSLIKGGINYSKVHAVYAAVVFDDSYHDHIIILDDKGSQVSNIRALGTHVNRCEFIALHPTEKAVIVSDYDNRKVVCICYIGGLCLWQVDLDSSPRGLTLTDDSLLVVTEDPCTIYQIGIHGDRTKTVIAEENMGINNGHKIVFDRESKILYFIESLKDVIKVFSTK